MEAPETIKDLLARVSKNLPEYGQTYGCPDCRDGGYVLFSRRTKYKYDATYGRPCPSCVLGDLIRKRVVRERAERETTGQAAKPERNKKLAHVAEDVDPDNIPF